MTEEVVGVFVSGYQIFRAIKLDEEGEDISRASKFGYKLIGPEEQIFYLMRVTGHPYLLIAMDIKNRVQAPVFSKIVFSDKNNELKIVEKRG